jgi:hypothetical protein
VRRYSGTRLNAARKAGGRLVHSSEQSIGVSIHLWALITTESARSTPSNAHRFSGHTIAAPAYAASTCSQHSAAAHASAIAATGSTAVEAVVPTVATTTAASDRFPSSSTRRRNSASHGTLRRRIPSIRAAFSTEECACSEHTTRSRPVASRAAISAARVEVEALSSMCPCHPAGSPTKSATHSSTTASSSVEAGAVRQRMATELRVAASSSARIPGSEALVAKYAK